MHLKHGCVANGLIVASCGKLHSAAAAHRFALAPGTDNARGWKQATKLIGRTETIGNEIAALGRDRYGANG